MEHVINRGPKIKFTYEGRVYIGYTRIYNNGDYDVEVYPLDDDTEQADGDVYEYAWKFFESIGLI